MTDVSGRWSPDTRNTLNKLDSVRRRLANRYVGRRRAVELLQLALICREHVLLLGEPGTAKTDLVMRFADLIDAKSFSYMLTRFTEPAEIFGSLDMAAFRDGRYRIHTDNMLPHADIAFLDEIFQGSSAILNSLLTLINERLFHNGPTPVAAGLITLVGASNELPEDPVLRAFADRMLLRVELARVAGQNLSELLGLGWSQEAARLREHRPEPGTAYVTGRREGAMLTVREILALGLPLSQVDLAGVTGYYQDVVRELLTANVTLSDRRIVRGQKLIAGAALLRGADRAELIDLWPLLHFWTDTADVSTFEEVVKSRLPTADEGPGDMVRSVEFWLSEARHIAARTEQRLSSGETGPHVLEGALTDLQRIRHELVRTHPGDAAAVAAVRQLIDRLLAVADDISA